MKPVIIAALFILSVAADGLGQTRQIVGRVISSEDQKPIRNANVLVLGSAKVAITNHLGFFSLDIEDDSENTLVISHIGYLTSRVDLPESNNFKILLNRDYVDIAELDLAYFNPLDSILIKRKTPSGDSTELSGPEIYAQYPGGWDHFFNDLGTRLLQDSVFKPGSDSALMLRFRVNAEGVMDEVQVDGDSIFYANYLKTVLSSMAKWTPASQHRHVVFQYFVLPIKWSEVFAIIEDPASPIGGMTKFYEYVGKNLNYPSSARSNRVGGRVFVEFVIDEKGKITSPRVVSGIGYGCDEEALRVISKAPDWQPGLQKGKPVKQRMVLPITFSISGYGITQKTIPSTPRIDTTIKDFYEFFHRNIKYPALARRMGVEGYVLLEFDVDTLKGKTKNVQIKEDIGADCGREVLSVFEELPWETLKTILTNKQRYMLPVGFGLGHQAKKRSEYPVEDEVEILKTVMITAMGIERTRRSTGDQSSSPYYSGSPSSGIPLIDANVHTSFEIAFLSRKRVEALSIVNKGVKEIPPKIEDLIHLRFLDLESNEIQNIPGELGALSRLEELYLRNNQLKTLPESFAKLTSLRILGLANNSFAEFPLAITELNDLEALDLSSNGLTIIPGEIAKLAKLKQLFLKNNKLAALPPELFELKSLERLYLDGNPLSFDMMTQLKDKLKKTEIFFNDLPTNNR